MTQQPPVGLPRVARIAVALILALAASGATAAGINGDSGNIVANVIAWFGDPKQWHGSDGIPIRTVEHLYYVLVSMAVAMVMALPVGIGLGHLGRGGLLAVNVSNVGRAIPELGVVVGVFLIAGYGDLPIVVTLIALAVPPMVTNSYVGMRAVDADIRQAARGVGMTGWQILWRVELPLAAPLVLAGIRTSAVQVVSTATLAAYVGLGGLGRYLIDGLAQQDMVQVVGGALVVALLAILVEAILAQVQRFIVSAGLVQ